MTDTNGFWPSRRVLVLGCTGYLGTHVVRALLARGADVVGVVRAAPRPGDFFHEKLYQHIHVVRGRADDPARVRSLTAAYEIEVAFQLAAAGDGDSTAATRTLLANAPPSCRCVVPVRPGFAPRGNATATFLAVPHLFGKGEHRESTWAMRAFRAAASNEPLPPGGPDAYLDVRDAADGLLASAEPDAHFTRLGAQGTASDMLAILRGEPAPRFRVADPEAAAPRRTLAESVADALAWQTALVPTPTLRARAA